LIKKPGSAIEAPVGYQFTRETRNREEKTMSDKVMMKIAWLLPKKLVMWCAIRLIAYATQGKYSDTVVPELTAMDAIKKWETA
jgi:hypothetical protein